MSVSKLPNKARYTNNDIMDGMREMHSCIHNVENRVDAIGVLVQEDRQAARTAVTAVEEYARTIDKATGERMARIEETLKAISASMGMKPSSHNAAPRPVKRFGSQRPITVVVQMVGATSSAILIMKTIGPAAVDFIVAVWASVIH